MDKLSFFNLSTVVADFFFVERTIEKKKAPTNVRYYFFEDGGTKNLTIVLSRLYLHGKSFLFGRTRHAQAQQQKTV